MMSAQAQTKVKGLLADSLTNEAEPYATVRIYTAQSLQNPNSQPVSMALTDIEGQFVVALTQKGNFVAVCSAVGKNAAVRPFTANGEKEIDLGKLLISDKESVMQSVEIVAVKPIVKMEADKITYSVEDDVDSRSMSVLDMLRKVPMVMVDGQDNITVNGQSDFKVYVDGKPNMMMSSNPSQILKAMPASMVSNIEVVTNPGAKYDAEGAGGILNITMAKMGGGAASAQSMNGYNGSIYAQGGNRGIGAGANVSGQHGKFSYNANFDYQYVDNGDVKVEMLREQDNGIKTDYNLTTKNTVPFMMGNIGLGYELTPLSQINASFGIQRFNTTTKGNPTTSMYGGSLGKGFGYSNRTHNKVSNTAYNGSIDFQRFFDAEHKGSFTLIYQTSFNPSEKDMETTDFRFFNNEFSSVLPSDRFSDGKENTMEHIVQTDLVNTLTEHSKLNYGAKYAFRKSSSDMDYYNINDGVREYDAAQSMDYENKNNVGAIYVESENTWTKFSAKAGLRYEHTWQEILYHDRDGQNFKKNYGNLVPSATLSYTLGVGQNIGLTYNMRISRPGITYLNPYIDRSEPTQIAYGNSNLDVEKNHNIGLTYNVFTPKIVVSASLRETLANGGIEQYSFYDKEGILNTTFGNIVDRRLTSLNLFAQWSATKTTRVILNGAVTYNYLTSSDRDKLDIDSHKGWSANAMVNIQQTLPKSWVLSLAVISNSKSLTLQGSTTGFNLGVLSVTKTLCKDRLSLSANAVTGLSKGGKLHIDQFSKGNDFTSSMNISVPITRFSFTARWNFGNTSKQFKKHTTNVQDDYIEHKSSTESIGNAGNMQQ